LPEQRIPKDHPLRAIRTLVDEALGEMSREFDQLYAQNVARPGVSAIDGRTTRHDGYAMSQHARLRVEPAFAWLKTNAWMRKVKLRGLAKVDWLFVFASAAFNLVRLPKSLPGTRAKAPLGAEP
jgi:hypothetical protein